MPPQLIINPPLLNSASPWATTADDLRGLLRCPFTGAVTTRTCLINGFNHKPEVHRYAFFGPVDGRVRGATASVPEASALNTTPSDDAAGADGKVSCIQDGEEDNDDLVLGDAVASLNSLGYSPITLDEYLDILAQLSHELPNVHKTVIVSVTGSPGDVAGCYTKILEATSNGSVHFPLAMEINLSCPNIPSLPPPAYSESGMSQYLTALPLTPVFPIGIKTPPFTYRDQYVNLQASLAGTASKLSFVTAVNTLGSCLLLSPSSSSSSSGRAVLPGDGLGGMAGPPLHPLALGNVATLRTIFDGAPETAHLRIIGVGGVSDSQGYGRMRAAGADAVALATALGRQGIDVFALILKGGDDWASPLSTA